MAARKGAGAWGLEINHFDSLLLAEMTFFCLFILTVEREARKCFQSMDTSVTGDTYVCVFNKRFFPTSWNGVQLLQFLWDKRSYSLTFSREETKK